MLDALPLASGTFNQIGLPVGGVSYGTSTGPGSGGGVGTSTGTGLGSGRGPGIGPGSDGGFVRLWRFEPGRLAGTAADVMVTFVMDFSIR